MPTNDYKAIANGGSANVVDQATFLALLAGALSDGFQAGTALSNQVNKVFRQSSVVSAALAKFLFDSLAVDILDDGDVAALATKIGQAVQLIGAAEHGQCLLSKSGGNLLLVPHNGNKLIINSQEQAVPDAGITLAIGATLAEGGTPAASTLYYIYAHMVSGSMVLQASATGFGTQAGTGVAVRNADATRTLVGMARTNASPAWVDTAAQRFVRSWFNSPRVSAQNAFAADRATTSTSYAELSNTERIEFLSWDGEAVEIFTNGGMTNTAAGGQFVSVSIGIDGTTAEDTTGKVGNGANTETGPAVCSVGRNDLALGYHYATILGKSSGGASCTFDGSATAGARTTIRAAIG